MENAISSNAEKVLFQKLINILIIYLFHSYLEKSPDLWAFNKTILR